MNISAEEFHIHFISYANIPFKAGIYASDLSIDWGDGTSSILKEKQYFNIVHHYQQEGLFHIKISGHRISNLNVSRLNLVDLQLEHCPSLEYLNCSINELKELDEDLDGNIDFYIVGLKPNSSRISIKFLYRKKFLDMLWNLARFQDELQVSEEVRVVSLSWIKKECLSPKSNSEKISPALFTKLFEAAIYGTNYPYSLLETMVRRVKTDKFINATRAGVIKAYLTRNEKKEEWKVSLDRRNNNQAYLCGRLFAVLENIQNQAVGGGKLNSTIKDKYFASAAAKPASIFPTLIKLSQHHMKKLNDGSQIFHAKLVGEIMNMLENEFPKTLPLMEQGKFMIGYYQQEQDFFASKNRRKFRKRGKSNDY